jgi:hypothetical protein
LWNHLYEIEFVQAPVLTLDIGSESEQIVPSVNEFFASHAVVFVGVHLSNLVDLYLFDDFDHLFDNRKLNMLFYCFFGSNVVWSLNSSINSNSLLFLNSSFTSNNFIMRLTIILLDVMGYIDVFNRSSAFLNFIYLSVH